MRDHILCHMIDDFEVGVHEFVVDWILLFVQGHLHPSTVIWGLKILTTIASISSLSEKFRTGTCNGHWLMKSEVVLQNKMIQALGQTSTSSSRATKRGVRGDIFAVPGFQLLNWLLPNHCEIPEMYFLLLSLALGKPMKVLPQNIQFNLDACFNHILGAPASSSNISDILKKVHFSGDAIVSIMTLVNLVLIDIIYETFSLILFYSSRLELC